MHLLVARSLPYLNVTPSVHDPLQMKRPVKTQRKGIFGKALPAVLGQQQKAYPTFPGSPPDIFLHFKEDGKGFQSTYCDSLIVGPGKQGRSASNGKSGNGWIRHPALPRPPAQGVCSAASSSPLSSSLLEYHCQHQTSLQSSWA